jgi:anti-anti-sigma factor
VPVHFSITDSPAAGQRVVLTVRGELDLATTTELARHLDGAPSERGLVVDLSGVTGIDESCVHAIAEKSRELALDERRLHVIVRDESLASAFERAGLGELLADDRRKRVRGPRFSD